MSDGYIQKDDKWFDKEGRQVWRAGTLVYDRKKLIRLFFWLFIGQFTFLLEFIAIPTLFPLLLNLKGFNAEQIGSLWAIFPLGALIVFPILGPISDRTRSRFGRRRPYDFATTPFWFIGLVLLPFVEHYWQAFACMLLIGFAGAGSNVLTAFYNDVVPPELMGRFVGGMRLMGCLGALFVDLVALRLFDSAPMLVFIGMACIGFVGEMLMLLMTKEGEYPPPPPKKPILKEFATLAKEGFANKYVNFLWLTVGVTALGGPVMATYFSLFMTNGETGLGYSTTQLGYIRGIGTAVGILLVLPAGWAVDRYGPKKIWAWCGFLVGLAQVLMFFFARDLVSTGICYTLYAVLNTILTVCLLPMLYCFLPKAKFGQMNASQQIVTRILQIIGAAGFGWVISFFHEDYRSVFLLGGIAYMLVPVFMKLMLREPYPFGEMETSMHPDGKIGQK